MPNAKAELLAQQLLRTSGGHSIGPSTGVPEAQVTSQSGVREAGPAWNPCSAFCYATPVCAQVPIEEREWSKATLPRGHGRLCVALMGVFHGQGRVCSSPRIQTMPKISPYATLGDLSPRPPSLHVPPQPGLLHPACLSVSSATALCPLTLTTSQYLANCPLALNPPCFPPFLHACCMEAFIGSFLGLPFPWVVHFSRGVFCSWPPVCAPRSPCLLGASAVPPGTSLPFLRVQLPGGSIPAQRLDVLVQRALLVRGKRTIQRPSSYYDRTTADWTARPVCLPPGQCGASSHVGTAAGHFLPGAVEVRPARRRARTSGSARGHGQGAGTAGCSV